jgi:lipopolysaccharide export LptBFGC system permease protein LptF
MVNSKPNPKRWYMVMVLCVMFSFFVFIVAPRLGYDPAAAHAIALMIGLWAPTLGILGVRAELLQKKE